MSPPRASTETETWTPLLVIVPNWVAELLTTVATETLQEATEEEQRDLGEICDSAGWPHEALAIGAWLKKMIEDRA